jgi:hypothetical protein
MSFTAVPPFWVTNNNPDARLDLSKNHCFTLDPDSGLGYDPNDPQCTAS